MDMLLNRTNGLLLSLVFSVVLVLTNCSDTHNHEASEHNHKHQNKKNQKASKTPANLKEIMQDLNLQMSRLQTGIMTSNRYMIGAAAKAIAFHPAPKGGIKPYLKKNKAQVKAKIPAIDKALHGAAKVVIQKAATAPFAELQGHYNTIASSCVACHNMFRD